jgi:hypothetical protein
VQATKQIDPDLTQGLTVANYPDQCSRVPIQFVLLEANAKMEKCAIASASGGFRNCGTPVLT